jgi:hypothetical protein
VLRHCKYIEAVPCKYPDKGYYMRYEEFGTFQEAAQDADEQRVKSQKQNAQRQMDQAKRQRERAKQADLALKQQRSQGMVAKLNRKSNLISP